MMYKTKPTILIVDDTTANIQLLAGILGNEYIVKFATSGVKALEIIHAEVSPDLILLDVMMPGMDGYEVCRRLKEDTKTSEIPVIFVSAKDEVKDQIRGFNLGAVDYIIKPFEPSLVKARVRTHVNLKLKTALLERLAMIDGLTGIPNRRRFDETFKKECSRALRNKGKIGILMIDIDYFKLYNDGYGHGAGDGCLSSIAHRLQESLERECDFVARYGGEEFVVILPEVDSEGAKRVAQKLVEGVRSLNLEHLFSKVSETVTISIGCVSLPIVDPESCKILLKRADEMLYQAKSNGRDRVYSEE